MPIFKLQSKIRKSDFRNSKMLLRRSFGKVKKAVRQTKLENLLAKLVKPPSNPFKIPVHLVKISKKGDFENPK